MSFKIEGQIINLRPIVLTDNESPRSRATGYQLPPKAN